MAQRVPERLRGLPGERAPGGVGDRAGDHHRQPRADGLEHVVDGEQRGLGVEGVEDGLDHQDVGAAFDQAVRGLAIGLGEFIERGRPEAGAIHVRAQRGGAAGGPEHADHESRFRRVACLDRIAFDPRQARALAIEFAHQVLEAVVGQRNAGRIEGVGLDQVRAGFQVLAVDVADDVRPGQCQQVVVAALVVRLATAARAMRMAFCREQHVVTPGEALAAVVGFLQSVALDHGAHRAVDDQDAVVQRGLEFRHAFRFQPGQRAHGFSPISEITSKCGGRRSRVTVSQLAMRSPAFSANLRSSFSLKPRFWWP